MAKLTFKGTTQEALAAITANDIDVGTKVTITDNAYDATDLLTIVQATNNHPVILEKTNSGVPLEGGAANLVEIIQGINKYTGAITVTGGTISADGLNILAKGTTGKVTAELSDTPITESLVSKLKDVSSSDNITFAPTGTPVVGKSNLEALVTLSKKLPNTNWSGIDKFEGTATEVSAIQAALKIIPAEVEITSGQISAADANALSKATGTKLTATIKTGSVKSTLAALKDIDLTAQADVLTFTTNDKTANASDLVALDAKIANGDYTYITTITEDAKNVGVAGKSVTDALTILGATTDVKISGAIDTASASAIAKDANVGDFTATVKPGTAADLVAALTGTTSAVDLTLTDTTVAADDLTDLDAVTTVAINANSVKTITGSVAEVTAAYAAATAKGINGLGNENVTITGGVTAAAGLNAVLKATSGIVTATVSPDLAATLVADLADAKATDALALTVTGSSTAANLLALDGKTSVAITLPATAAISGTAADVKKVYAAKGITTVGDEVITLTTDSSAADVNAIAAGTSGAVTATIKGGSVAATLKALGSIDTATDVLTFKTTDKSAKASDLFALSSKFSDLTKFDASAVKTITGTASDVSDIKAILNAVTGITTLASANPEVKITGTISAADAGAISALTTAKVTANLAADTATNLVADLAGAGTNDALNITVNGLNADAADLAGATGLTTKTTTTQKIKVNADKVTAADYAEFDSVYLSGKPRFSNLGDENITVTAAVNAAQADNVAKATNKKATAIISTDDASVLVANLKNAKATDAFTITLAAAPASAKDLLTLDSKTSVALVATAVTKITGSVADVNKVIAAGTAPATITLPANPVYTLSGTVKAADVDAIAKTTSGIVTATIAADTAAKLNAALTDNVGTNAYTLTVNGATATATELIALRTKAGTAGTVKVDAKEISGLLADVTTVVVTNTGSQFIALGTENIKISNTVTANATNLNNILAATNGVVTATVAADTAANLVTNVANATAKDALTLVTTNAAATASQLLALDDKTSVKVDATAIIANGITGSSAELKKLVASKGVELSGSVALTVSDAAVKAADLGAILKATTGVVTATVAADTATKLASALKDANSLDALTLTVNGTSAAAKDLISLTTSTNSSSVAIKLDVAAITGNINEVTNVFVTSAAKFDNVTDIDATISGTIGAAQADAVATVITAGTVTATIDAGTAAYLNSTLTDTDENAYKLKLTGNDATASDLNRLDAKTSIAIDASAIKNITIKSGEEATGAADIKNVYVAAGKKDISGLGNETVDLTGATDANVALVNAINNYTTGVITLPDLVLTNAAPATFNLKQLGDLKGITGLEEIDANNGVKDTLNISLKDLLEANDSTTSFTLDIIGGGSSEDDTLVMGDITGWTEAKGTYTGNSSTEGTGTITYTKGSQVITIDLTNVIFDI